MRDCSRCNGTGFEYLPMPKYIPTSPDVCDEDEDIYGIILAFICIVTLCVMAYNIF